MSKYEEAVKAIGKYNDIRNDLYKFESGHNAQKMIFINNKKLSFHGDMDKATKRFLLKILDDYDFNTKVLAPKLIELIQKEIKFLINGAKQEAREILNYAEKEKC